jgi:hypothetical protein
VDACPAQGSIGFGVDATGCPIQDTDGDGFGDNVDACPAHGSIGFGVDATGCPIQDSDGDGVGDNVDLCPALGGVVNGNGCPDSDGDGYFDDVDACPTQGDAGFGVDSTGCPNAAPVVSVSALTLINTDTQAAIMSLSNGSVIDLSDIGTNNIAIRATIINCNAPPNCSVQFFVNSALFSTENSPPYSIQGDSGGNLNPWSYGMGAQTIEARPFTNPNGNGTQGTSFTVNITINP